MGDSAKIKISKSSDAIGNSKAKSTTSSSSTAPSKPVKRRGGDTGREWGDSWPYWSRLVTGIVLTINFVIFWAVPIFGQGQAWKQLLCRIFSPVYNFIDRQPTVRAFAAKYIYRNPRHADFFTQSLLVMIGWGLPFLYVLRQQAVNGTLTWGETYFYYFAWVGFGGRIMGGAYTFAHKEGHNNFMYKPWISNSIGNWFENWVGNFFGNVPYNFSASHIYIHHRLNAGSGDTFYQWDLDRTSWAHFMFFLHRIILHTCGVSSLMYFVQHKLWKQTAQLVWGCIIYWLIVPSILWYFTRSWSFFFFIYIQPQICMTFFLAFMNYAFHAFIDYDERGRHVTVVNSTTIIEGEDDYFGEDDHMAHHNATHVYWRDLPKHQQNQIVKWRTHNASVFRGLSIVELAAFILFKDWKTLAKHYVQFNTGHPEDDQHDKSDGSITKGSLPNGQRTEAEQDHLCEVGSEDLTETFKTSVWNRTGKLSDKEVIAMLKARATRLEPLKTPYIYEASELYEGMGAPEE